MQNIFNAKYAEKQIEKQSLFSKTNRETRRENQRKRKSFDFKIKLKIIQEFNDKYWHDSFNESQKENLYYDWVNYLSNSIRTAGIQEQHFLNFCKLKYKEMKPDRTKYREDKLIDLLK